jgi:haloacetate dehalogenase
MIVNSVEVWLKTVWFKDLLPSRIDSQAYAEYLRCFRDPAMIHATCEDYRAGASIDLEHDKADLDHKISCPMLALWGSRGHLPMFYDPVEAWKERALDVRGRTISSGHFIAEEDPQALLAELKPFLS